MVDHIGRFIDYRMNILGVRVWKDKCQLIARRGNTWFPMGPASKLPIVLPSNTEEFKAALENEISITGAQFTVESPNSDIRDVLSQQKDFAAALSENEVS